jgi:divalent metal cation (Fe/Co/Zn/Cd) transporter
VRLVIVPGRRDSLRTAVRLSTLSVLWNATAGVAATVAAVLAGSLALLGFGLDSVIDGAASCVLIWRFSAEARDPDGAEALEQKAARAVGITLGVIGVYVGVRAVVALTAGSETGTSPAGLAIAAASLLVLPPLALAKRRTAARLGSRALRGDSVLTAIGAALAGATLASLAVSRGLGWWWADSVVALGVAVVLAREALALLREG